MGVAVAGLMLAAPAVAADVSAQTSCDPSYPDFCIAPAYEVGDLDCPDIAGAYFTVIQPDGHGFDADYDGYGCESN
jgi:hypothetical protein